MTFFHSRIQHGVGQGSFHSATVTARATIEDSYRFDYVYDCGGLSGAGPLERSIKRLSLAPRQGIAGPPVIDALVLSHYDQDHINGVLTLVERFKVQRMFVPYLGLEELLLVVAAQANTLSNAHLQQLHALAHGSGTFGGVAVTQVQRGQRSEEGELRQPGERRDPDDGRNRGEPVTTGNDDGLPLPSDLLITRTGQAPGATMSDEDDLSVAIGGVQAHHEIWKLRFWNRGLSDDLFLLIFEALIAIDFPLSELADPAGFLQVANWLQIKGNREATVAAYGVAIGVYQPAWIGETAGAKLANFLSLGMYAGPAHRVVHADFNYRRLRSPDSMLRGSDWDHPLHCTMVHDEIGWLGTGDAPLGEPGVWNDFSTHYLNELPSTLTVLIPHHGAAPRGGPRFFNPGLNHRSGVISVISVGTKNNHGHPMPDVLGQILRSEGDLQLVTEESLLGFQEVFWMDAD